MFIGHLPAGYILSSSFKSKPLKTAVLIGSIIPDIDLIYFYTIGQRAVVHHAYWTHMPFFWLLVCLISWPVLKVLKLKLTVALPVLFCGIILHLILDSITGSVFWLMPFSDRSLTLVTVPALYKPWQLNFIFHWTFAFEILICCLAAVLFFKRRIFFKL